MTFLVKPWKKQVGQGVLEIVSRDPLMILDGAHNPHAIKALLVTLQERLRIIIRKSSSLVSKPKPWRICWTCWGAMPDTELTLTHFADSRATDESVLKEGS